MSDASTTEERVIRAIKKVIRNREIRADDTFEALGIDSLSANEILFEVEDEFDITLPAEGIQGIRGVRDVILGVERHLAGGSEAAAGGTASP